MTRYVIVRHGANGANQHLANAMVLGIVEADNRELARAAAAERWTCYTNQYFDPIPWLRASNKQRALAEEWDGAQEWGA